MHGLRRTSVIAILLLWGCTAPTAVPVVERAQPPSEKITTHWVASGETLYAIAWRYNLNVDDLARANGIASRNTLKVDQLLRLDVENAALGKRKRPAVLARESADKTVGSRKGQMADKPLAQLASWHWPVQGKLIKPFSFKADQGYKGLAINGRIGEAVYAAQNGRVVYAGSGLPAYGKLLIVKHGNQYLSAYAHNSRLLVKEGDSVRAGQKIAEVGKTGASYAHLYFEIRKRGVPVDPLALLPRRRA